MGIQYEKNAVVITEAPAMNYFGNHVRLPDDYGTPAYDERPDVKAIKATVRKSLDDLDAATGWKDKFRGRKVLIKPNLVFVYLKEAGRFKEDNPQTTDPRVFDAVIDNLQELGCDVLIGEGSGLVTWLYARMTGYDRIAKHHGIKMTFFEEEPMVHYFVPHAEVGQDVYVPQSFKEVIEGERLYVSVPKTKTNVYTGVTLGFKNGMGTFSPNMRYRNHNWKINKKLADLLYLFKPDLTVVDAIIGGGGNTPGPNIPVEMNRIVSGSNSVEVDRVVTELMGFDPSKNKLLIEASARNFGDPNVEIIGEKRITPFEPAEPSVMTDKFHKNWPRVHGYAGWTNDRAPKLEKIDGNPRSLAQEMEAVNAGFDGASMATTFECMLRGYTYPLNKYRRVNIIYGDGAELNGVRYWLGEDGHAYTVEELKKLPGIKIGCGEVTKAAADAITPFFWLRGEGEVFNVALRTVIAMQPALPANLDVSRLPLYLAGFFRRYFIKKYRAATGHPTEPHFDAYCDKLFTIPELAAKNLDVPFVEIPMPKMGLKARREAMKDVNFLAQFLF